MAKISEVAKAECVRRQNKYKDLLSVVESKLNKLEKEISSIDDELLAAYKKIDLAVLYINASSLIATSCYVAIDSIDVRSENQLNDGRRYINKAIIIFER